MESAAIPRGKMSCGGRVLAVFLLLLLNTCEGRTHGLTSPGRRRLLASEAVEAESPSGFSLTMLHRDHEQSPLRISQAQYMSFGQRMKEAARRSRERTKSIRHKIHMLVGEPEFNASTTHQRKAQLLGLQSPVFAQQGEFIVNIHLGTPAKKFVAILDSGSDLAWVQCTPCTTCIPNVTNPLFDPSHSSSYQDLPCANDFCNALPSPSPVCSGSTCPFVYQYGDGTSTSGDFATETITLELTSGSDAEIPGFAFGCGTDNSGDLSGSDGVIGIGRGSFSMPSQLSSVVGNKFSFCLVSIDEATIKTSPLMIGNDSFASASGARWTPILKNHQSPTFYYVYIHRIQVGGHDLEGIPATTFAIDSSGNGGTIIDTGTTITELLPAAYNVLVSDVGAAVPYPTVDATDYGFDLCWDITAAASSGPVFPPITFQFKWSEFTLPNDSAYMLVDLNVVCLCFSSGSGINIIGNVHLQNFQMFVNNDDGVLGWKPAECDKIQ